MNVRRTSKLLRRAVLAVAGLVLATPATAQPEAFLLTSVPGCVFDCGTTITLVAPDTPAVLSAVVDGVGRFMQSPYVTPDGRLLAGFTEAVPGISPARVSVRDLTAGTTQTIDVPGAGGLLGNPARAEVYLSDAAGPLALGLSGVRRFTGPACVGGYPIATSGNGRRLLTHCQFTPTLPGQDLLFDIDSGQFAAALPPWTQAALNQDGSEVYAVEFVNSAYHLRRFDVATGAVLADAPIPSPQVWSGGVLVSQVHVDHRRSQVLLVGRAVHAFDGTSLTLLRSAGFSSTFGQVRADSSSLDEVFGRFYVTTSAIFFGSVSFTHEVFDADTLASVVYVPFVDPGRFVPVPKPFPPSALAATVTGTAVGLSWVPGDAPPAATRHVLEVGSGPGLNDIFSGLDVGLRTSFAASGVPPGIYYVRVRAGNYTGLSAPSNEVAIVVP